MLTEFPRAPGRGGRSDPGRRLLDALARLTGEQGSLLRHQQRPWASITFSGTRHMLTYAFEGQHAIAAGEALIAALPEHEFTIPRQIVADVQIRAVDHVLLPEPRLSVDIELLMLEEA